MSAVVHRNPTMVQMPRKPTRTPAQAIIHEDPAYRDAYELLFEAAHLVTQASRELRGVHETEAGFALQALADEIHAHIRQLPASARYHRSFTALTDVSKGSEH